MRHRPASVPVVAAGAGVAPGARAVVVAVIVPAVIVVVLAAVVLAAVVVAAGRATRAAAARHVPISLTLSSVFCLAVSQMAS
jgi:hypothetical protein